MADQYASIIIDISHEDVDRVFQYRIPPALLPHPCGGAGLRPFWFRKQNTNRLCGGNHRQAGL